MEIGVADQKTEQQRKTEKKKHCQLLRNDQDQKQQGGGTATPHTNVHHTEPQRGGGRGLVGPHMTKALKFTRDKLCIPTPKVWDGDVNKRECLFPMTTSWKIITTTRTMRRKWGKSKVNSVRH